MGDPRVVHWSGMFGGTILWWREDEEGTLTCGEVEVTGPLSWAL